jgi:uncharacterized protein
MGGNRFGVEFSEPVRDPLWGDINLPVSFLPILESPPFVKLMGIRQLGPAYLAYPGATHTRFSHSIGVFEMAKRTLSELFTRCELNYVTPEGALSFLAAALCHDLGHFPFAHSLKELPLRGHEALTADLVQARPLKGLLAAAGVDPGIVEATVDSGRPDGGDRQIRLFRRLLSGTLDPDKLDYLTRDAYFCGVPYGVQDTDFVLRHLSLAPDDVPGIDTRGIMSVESILFSKYLMYRSVYWHRSVRTATAMVKKSVLALLSAGAIHPEELYDLDDSGFRILMEGTDSPEAVPAMRVFRGELYATACEIPFLPGEPRHAALVDLSTRSEVEDELRKGLAALGVRLDPPELVVDLPEPVSFESDLPVLTGEPGADFEPFRSSATVFKPPVVDAFVHALRTIRVFLPRRALSEGGERVGAFLREVFGAQRGEGR